MGWLRRTAKFGSFTYVSTMQCKKKPKKGLEKVPTLTARPFMHLHIKCKFAYTHTHTVIETLANKLIFYYYYSGYRRDELNLPFRRGNLLLTEVAECAKCTMKEADHVAKTLEKFFISDNNGILLGHVPLETFHRKRARANYDSCAKFKMLCVCFFCVCHIAKDP